MKQEDLFNSLSEHFESKAADLGDTEELTEANFVIPEEEDYVDFGEETEEVDVAGLWENIRKKKEREGKNYRPAKPGDKDRPSQEALKRAQGAFKYKDPVTGELFYFERKGNYKKNGRMLSFVSKADLDEPDPMCEQKEPRKKDTSFVGKHQVTAPPTMTWQGAKAAFDEAKALCEEAIAEYEEGQMQREQLMKMHQQLMEMEEYLDNVEFEDWTKDMISKSELYIQNIYDFIEAHKGEKSEALQYGKPKKNDPRKTPAKPSERKKGSKKNKPDSAKDDKGKITFSKSTMEKLSKAMREHNAKGKGSKATMGQLKAVYRRGAGAFSTSHAPNMSRDGWGMARVRAFLYLLRNGRPSNPNYKQDNDLLPKGHPRSSKASMTEKQKEALDKDKDGKITKKDFEMLRESKGAEYKGRKVTLNKPFRTPSGPKKFAVYTKNESGNVVIVRFGDPNMKIKKNIPERRKSFRARHNCDNPGPKWKARYWSCRAW